MKSILWVDVETTGTDPYSDLLLEVAAIATDMAGNHLSDLKTVLIPPKNLLKAQGLADPYVLEMHNKSNLWKDLWGAPPITLSEAEDELTDWIAPLNLKSKETFFGGNSIKLDRDFLALDLPSFYQNFNHRSIDVTSIALMLQNNFNMGHFRKEVPHRAGADILESVEEYRHYLRSLKNDFFLNED